MTPREVVAPTTNERGEEEHPAWGLIGAYRSQGGENVLFDSDIRHNQTITVRISTASRRRDLHRDYIRATGQFVEVQMSEAQWASFVSTMNVGDGVPCTIRRRGGRIDVPEIPFESRLHESMGEVRSAADKAFAKVREAFDTYAERKNAENLRALKFAIQNAAPNVAFAGDSLTEHAENVVQRARADIEAMVVGKAQQLGIDPGELGGVGELTPGGGDG